MYSQRILSNEKLYNQIKNLEIEYSEKLNVILCKILATEKLSELEVLMINSVLTCTAIISSTIKIHTYEDKNDRENVINDVLYYYKHILIRSELIWKQISSTYEECINIVTVLANQMKAPRRILTIDNMKTLEDYHKLIDRFIRNHSISDEEFNNITNKLYRRGKEIGIVNW